MAKETTETKKAFSSKVMLNKANENKTVIRYGERVPLEIVEDTKHYRKGMRIEPHKLVADELIANKIAKKVSAETLEKEAKEAEEAAKQD